MKALNISAIVLVAGLATGCSSVNKADIDSLQAQIDSLNAQMTTVSADVLAAKTAAASASSAATLASSKAFDAEKAANRAAQYAQDTNSKLDRMFKKSMMK